MGNWVEERTSGLNIIPEFKEAKDEVLDIDPGLVMFSVLPRVI